MVNTKIRLIIFFAAKDGEALYKSAKTRPGADCDSDHELLIAKYRLKLKKVEKTTRPFRYDLNQTPYDYTVEVRNRFKGLDLIDRVPDELWMEVRDTVQETGIKNIPKKKKCKKFQRISRRDKKAFLRDQCKEIEENNRMGKNRDLFKKIRDTREHFTQRWAQ